MIEDAAATTTTSLVPDVGSEQSTNNILPNDTNGGEEMKINVVKEGENAKMSFKKKLLLRKALSKATVSSDSGNVSIDDSTVAADSSSSDDAAAAEDDVNSESYSKSNQPKAFRQSTGDHPRLSPPHIFSHTIR